MPRLRFDIACAVAAFALATAARAEDTPTAPPAVGSVTLTTTPEQYLAGAKGNAARRMTGKYTGNGWAWHACFPMNGFLDAYLATGEEAWLDAAAEYFDWNIGLLLTSPDGFKGWLGPVAAGSEQLGEHPIDDAIMCAPMVRFAEIVLKDRPALAKVYGPRARAYVALARKLMFEKWDARRTWHEDGPYGVFTEWPWTYTEAAADRWQPPPPGTRAITLPFNMQVVWGLVAARIARIDGDAAMRQRALKLFNFLKSRLCLYQDHYSWNYWEPFGPWDVDPQNPQAFRHWIGTHPYRDYQAGEVAEVVAAFHHGITFDADDMRRFVNTNVKVMWNGKLDDIQWHNSNAGVQQGAFGEIRLPSKPQGMFNRYAGTLWADLADFDPSVRRIRQVQLKAGSIPFAYFHNVVRRRPPSYERHITDAPAEVCHRPFNSCCTLTMVAVMPSRVVRGKPSRVSCFARIDGDLSVELVSADGKTVLQALRPPAAQGRGVLNIPWDAAGVARGAYRVRWTLRGERREFPIVVE